MCSGTVSGNLERVETGALPYVPPMVIEDLFDTRRCLGPWHVKIAACSEGEVEAERLEHWRLAEGRHRRRNHAAASRATRRLLVLKSLQHAHVSICARS